MYNEYEMKFLKLLSKEFPTIQSVCTEIINLTAILNLPKGTEHFLSDIHGEYEAFNHFLKNGSGVIRKKIDTLFYVLSEEEKNRLAFLIYYPQEMVDKYENKFTYDDFQLFLRKSLLRLISMCRFLSTNYTKSKIRKSLPKEFAYIIEELIFESSEHHNKYNYYNAIIDAIFKTKREKEFIIEVCKFIQRITVDRLHIIGDIFDRGSYSHLVMELIDKYHTIDIQWGNHDILWMGATSGNTTCIANVVRISSRYNNLDVLEDGYGINLLPLASLARKYYSEDPCVQFQPKSNSSFDSIDDDRKRLVSKMHKAISIIQFKLEHEIIKRNPLFYLDDRLLLDKINYKDSTITINGETFKLTDSNFPTIDPSDPYKLNEDEEQVIKQLKWSFLNNKILQRHINLLFIKGSMYLKYNGNLLFHGCIPLNNDGTLAHQLIKGKYYSGKALFEQLEVIIRQSYSNRYYSNDDFLDYFLFLWQGENSPLFGKKAMKTFERYFIEDKKTHYEETNNYFSLRESEEVLKTIFDEFSLDWEKSKIVNGHVPVDITLGHSPILANNKIYSIDGGMSKTFREKIQIGGYTLVSDSNSIYLVSHERFTSINDLIDDEKDIVSILQSQEINTNRDYIYDTDKGKDLQKDIDDLYKLLDAYRSGIIKETK